MKREVKQGSKGGGGEGGRYEEASMPPRLKNGQVQQTTDSTLL